MNFYWIYDFSNGQLAFLIIGCMIFLAITGIPLMRPLVPRFALKDGHNILIGTFMGSIGALYGITVGLTAVAAWDGYSSTNKSVTLEAATMASMYSHLEGIPEPQRATLLQGLRAYAETTIQTDWPAQQQGQIPQAGLTKLQAFYRTLIAFEPKGRDQDALNSALMEDTAHLFTLHQARMQRVIQGMPLEVWYVVLLGGLVIMGMSWLMLVERRLVHLLAGSALAFMLGLMIFFVAAMDNPLRGQFSVSADSLRTVLEKME